MYHALLTNRYLTSRVIPFIAVAAVALCVALVIIVVSVMTGFLDMVKNSGRTLIGDVVVAYQVAGIPHYERLIEHIERLPEAAAATPVVDAYGLLRMPYPEGPNKHSEIVNVWGIEPESFSRVTGYDDILHWRELEPWQRHFLLGDVVTKQWPTILDWLSSQQRIELVRRVLMRGEDESVHSPSDEAVHQAIQRFEDYDWEEVFRLVRSDEAILQAVLTPEQWEQLLQFDPRLLSNDHLLLEGLTLQRSTPADPQRQSIPGIALGIHVSEGNLRTRTGDYEVAQLGHWWMPRHEVLLTTIPITDGTIGGAETAESRILPVVNEYISGVYHIDDMRVMIPLDVAQSMLHMDQAERVDPTDPTRVIGIEPARATKVLVRAADGVTPERLRNAVERAYIDFENELLRDESVTVLPPPHGSMALTIKTWLQQQEQFIGPVEKERELMRTLFSLVYLVCAGLVLAIFWAIVYEKTRDIGILRSIGASRMGISWIFLRYGLLIGVVGAVVGLGLGYLVVKNINLIHETLGNPPLELAIAVLILAGISLLVTIMRGLKGNLLPIVLGGLVTAVLATLGLLALWLWRIGGIIVWDPSIYYFTEIPNNLDMQSAAITMIGAVIFSLIGAFIPAAKAADTDPVKALRYE